MSNKSLNKFVFRYAVRQVLKNGKGESESVILLTDKKTLCNDSEQNKFYARIGGILNLQDLMDQKVKSILEKIDVYGYYTVMSNHRSYLGFNTYPVIFPNLKVPNPEETCGVINSFLPRYHSSKDSVICGLKILNDDKNRGREWSRYIGSDKSNHQGFVELSLGFVYINDHKLSSRRKLIGFYVGKHTTLLMHDIVSMTATKANQFSDLNRTLIQEGGFVYADAEIRFRLCDDSESKLYTDKELYEKFKDTNTLGSDRYKRSHIIRDKDPKKRSTIIFLKSNPFVLPFELTITDDMSKDPLYKNKRLVVLSIPSGGEFEYPEYWEMPEGIKSVNDRQKKEPWNKFIDKNGDSFEAKINELPAVSFPNFGTAPQSEGLCKKLRKARKQVSDAKSGQIEGHSEKIQESKPQSPQTQQTSDAHKEDPGSGHTNTQTEAQKGSKEQNTD